jgi:uncharacterized membrane protein YsdA (DUF1294 family)
MLALAGTWLLLVNVWTFLRFGSDKRRAALGLRRIPESSLLGLMLIGGTVGAYAGRRAYRHMTRKEPFTTQMHTIAICQIGAIIGYLLAGTA